MGRTLQLGSSKWFRNRSSEREEEMEIGIQEVGVKSIRDVWSEPGPLWSYHNTCISI